MRDTILYEQLLGLTSPWKVEGVTLNKDKKEIEVLIGFNDTTWACPECALRLHIHGYKERQWRHLDTCQYQTIIKARMPLVKCITHGTQVVKAPWSEKYSRFTTLFERFAIDVLQECSISGACNLLRITWDEADGIKTRAVKRGLLCKQTKNHEHLGVDEKSFGSGKNYITLVANISKGESTVEFISDSNTIKSLDKYWESLCKEQLESILSVNMDMWPAYKTSTIANVPYSADKIVHDRFHIMQHMNKAVNAVRKAENKTLIIEGDETLLGTRQIWLYAKENLPNKYEPKFEKLKDLKLKTARAWAIKEQLREFWNCGSIEEGRAFYKKWYNWAIRSQLKPVRKVARMVKNHYKSIENYFNYRTTNATLEGINSKIQGLVKKAYGYRNKERFKTDIFFHCGGLNLYPAIP